MMALANLFPHTLYRPTWQVIYFMIVVLCAYLMTGSTINYLRWGGRAIAVQALAAVAVGVAAHLALGTPGTFLAVYFIAFCSIYIVFHPTLVLFRRTAGVRKSA